MAQIEKMEIQTELKCPADKFLEVFTSKTDLLSQICPDKLSVQVIEGDGKTVGSVTLWSLCGISESAKDRLEAIDELNKSLTFKIIDGNVLKYYKTYTAKFEVITEGKSCFAKCIIEYEKLNEDVTPPTKYLEIFVSICKDIDAYFLNP